MRCAILLASVFMLAATASFEETFDEENLVTKVPEESLLEEFVDAPVKVSAKAQQVFTEAELSAKGPYWKWTNKFKTKKDGKYRLREQHSSKKKVTKREWTLIESAKKKPPSKKPEPKPMPKPEHKAISLRVESYHDEKDPEFVQTKAGRRRLCARLYQHSNFRGRVYNVYSNVGFLRGFNDQLSSMRVYNCHIRLYQHSNYRGRSHGYNRGNYNYHVIRRTIGNDQVSSVRVWHRRQHRHRRRVRATRAIYRHGLWRENVYYFGQGGRVPHLANRRANMQRWRHTINYRNTGGRWPGFARAHNFAVRWTARVRFFRSGRYRFSLISDDGSKLWINNRYTINNDGLHGWRNREATRYIRAGWTMMRVEFFERGGHHGCLFRYRGPDTGNRWKVVRAGGTRTPAHG